MKEVFENGGSHFIRFSKALFCDSLISISIALIPDQ
jgi:hypothetical protein